MNPTKLSRSSRRHGCARRARRLCCGRGALVDPLAQRVLKIAVVVVVSAGAGESHRGSSTALRRRRHRHRCRSGGRGGGGLGEDSAAASVAPVRKTMSLEFGKKTT